MHTVSVQHSVPIRSDGFMITPANCLPAELNDFVDLIVPEL